ncbi:sensor histidine kinase [Flavobacterium lindanitolerans]|nr:sensor histidine kinase [Flavobacterium lindanitolerans]
MDRAIANLIDNAVKYSTSTNSVVEIRSSIENGELLIAIADNGPGIPDEHKEAVFSPFYRIPSGNIHNVKGYGLGLSYVKR